MHEAMKSKSGARIFHLSNPFAASSPPRSPLAFSRISQLKVRWLACRSFTRSTNQTDAILNVRSPELSGPEANLASPLPPDLQVWLGAESDRPQYATHCPITQLQSAIPPVKKAYEYEWKAFFRTKHDTPRPLEPSRTLRTLLTVVAHSARSRDERVPELLLTTSPLTQLFVSLISTRFRPFPPFFSSSSSSALHLYLIYSLSKYHHHHHHHHLCSLLAIRVPLFYSQKAAFTFKIIVVCLTDVASAPAQQSRIRRQLHTSNPDFA